MSTSTPARANGRRRRAWSLDCLALGLYAAPNPGGLVVVDTELCKGKWLILPPIVPPFSPER